MPLFLSAGPPLCPPFFPHRAQARSRCSRYFVLLPFLRRKKSREERERERERRAFVFELCSRELLYVLRVCPRTSLLPRPPPPWPHLVEPYFRSSPELTGHQSVRLQFFCMPRPRSSLSLARVSLVRCLLSPSSIYDYNVSGNFR